MGKRIGALLALGLALVLVVPVLGLADPPTRHGDSDDEVITITQRDDGRRIVVRSGDEVWDFDEEDWRDLDEMLEEIHVDVGSVVEEALESLEDVDWDDLDRLPRRDRHVVRVHGDVELEGLEALGERLERMGERLSARLEHRFDDHGERWEDHGERWEEFGERLAERIERSLDGKLSRDVARGLGDVRIELDEDLDPGEVERLQRDVRRQMRRLQKELRRLERELERLENWD